MDLRPGTSGFSYDEWKGPFYPEDVAKDAMLSFYAAHLPAVEINNTFYRMPKGAVLEKWCAEVPATFRFVLKAPQRITHHRKLRDPDSVAYFFSQAAHLGERMGPTLFQLPPWLKKDVPLLTDFLATVPPERRIALEVRSSTWLDDEVLEILRARDVALCIADFDESERSIPFVPTASWGYLRLRAERYDDAQLREWIDRVSAQPWSSAWVFFKHEGEGVAPRLAMRFGELATGTPAVLKPLRKVEPAASGEAALPEAKPKPPRKTRPATAPKRRKKSGASDEG